MRVRILFFFACGAEAFFFLAGFFFMARDTPLAGTGDLFCHESPASVNYKIIAEGDDRENINRPIPAASTPRRIARGRLPGKPGFVFVFDILAK